MAELDAAMTESVTPIVFSSVAHEDVRSVLRTTRCAFIDLFGSHMDIVERVLHVNASPNVPALHGLGYIRRYEQRMKAIDFSLEHDDGASLRNLLQAELILIAPSRCGGRLEAADGLAPQPCYGRTWQTRSNACSPNSAIPPEPLTTGDDLTANQFFWDVCGTEPQNIN